MLIMMGLPAAMREEEQRHDCRLRAKLLVLTRGPLLPVRSDDRARFDPL
jgi:hypothetical protein